MMSVQQAESIFKNKLTLRLPLIQQNIQADRPYPPFDRVMMDGIAVKFSELAQGKKQFPLTGVFAAGEPRGKLVSGAVEIMTGAPLPEGADVVIPYEHLQLENGAATLVKETEYSLFENIHRAGSDCAKGEVVLEAGSVINGPHAGIAASMGMSLRSQQPRILLISTGDELVEVEERPLEHQIRRSNVHALAASLKLFGFEQLELFHLNDDPGEVAEHFITHTSSADVMIYSGGVSKGKFDYLPNVWADLGVTRHLHQVAQRPGKPLWFGTDEKNKTSIIGLPGNPISSLVCLHRYVLPQRQLYVRLREEIRFKNSLTYFVPVKLQSEKDGSLWAEPLDTKNSGEFIALAGSDGFIELPAEPAKFSAGESFQFFSWRSF